MKAGTLALLLAGIWGTGASAWANNTVWIDVSSPQDYAAEHLVDAVHIPYTHIAREVSRHFPDKNTQLKLYDRNQRNARLAQEALQTLGYAKASNNGALADLKAQGLATEQAVQLALAEQSDQTLTMPTTMSSTMYSTIPSTIPSTMPSHAGSDISVNKALDLASSSQPASVNAEPLPQRLATEPVSAVVAPLPQTLAHMHTAE
ncbi:rhodanese-like domain-containing protein [Oceanisphaera sp. W20_SRM_FM3]|uniref:rhodanese-like domain-containing protein n=1 Tax=Oceanisphaera sp. W20_SRM_FM3 TaxID=3240267 RepID=UPI003F9E84CB